MTDLETAARAALEAMKEAREDIAHWAAYADAYFKDKHDLAGDLARQDASIAALEAALSDQNSAAVQAVTAAPEATVSGSMSASDADLIAALRAGDNGAVNKRLWELLDRADDRLSAVRNVVLMEAAAQCFIGPSDEWSEGCKSGYLQAADDCRHRIRALADVGIAPVVDYEDEAADRSARRLATQDRTEFLLRDAEARQRGENLDGSPRRETVPVDPAAIRRAALEEAMRLARSVADKHWDAEEDARMAGALDAESAIRALAKKEPGETYSTPVGAYSKLGTPYSTPDPAAIRRAALEEAAAVAFRFGSVEMLAVHKPYSIAAAIRALADKEPTDAR